MIGDYIQTLRNDKDMTQDDLSKMINITRSALHNIENSVYPPGHEVLLKLSSVLNVPMSSFLGHAIPTYEPANEVNIEIGKRIRKYRKSFGYSCNSYRKI